VRCFSFNCYLCTHKAYREVGETHPSPPEGRELNGADDVQGTVQ